MKKFFTILALCGILMCGLSASAKPMGGPHGGHHGGPQGMPPRHHMHRPTMGHHMMPPPMHFGPTFRHRITCPAYRGYGWCTCHRHYRNGIYIDFRVPIVF